MHVWSENWNKSDEERLRLLNGQTCRLCLEEDADVQVRKLTSEPTSPNDDLP